MTFNSRLKPAVSKRVIDLYRKGAKVADITEETGVARSTIYWLLKDQGVQTRKKPGPKPPPNLDPTVEHLLGVIAEQQERLLLQERTIGQLEQRLRQE